MRNLARCLLSVAILALPTLGAANPASAQTLDLICPGATTLNFNPGLTLIPQTQTITGEVHVGTSLTPATPCSSLTGAPYRGGIGTVSGTGTLGCVGGTASGTATISWNNGDSSTIAWRFTTIPPVPVLSATAVDGLLQGAFVLITGIPTALTGMCLVPVTSVTGAGIGAFIRLV